MFKGKMKQIVSGALAASLLFSLGTPYNVLAEGNSDLVKLSNVEKILKNLTDEQRRALKEVDASYGFTISPEINQNSSELIDVIVEFVQDPAQVATLKEDTAGKKMTFATAEKKVEDSHQKFKTAINSMKKQKSATSTGVKDIEITQEYRHALNGVALKVPANLVEKLVQTGLVKRVWPNKKIELDLPKEKEENKRMIDEDFASSKKEAANKEESATEKNESDKKDDAAVDPTDEEKKDEIETDSPESDKKDEATPGKSEIGQKDDDASSSTTDVNPSLPQINADKLHKENITGKGIKVGVLDSGIDYNHPDLTNAYKGYRAKEGEDPKKIDPNLVKGWDFVDNDADPMETTYEEWKQSDMPEFASNGSSYYTYHGTHVSGTVAAQQKNNVPHAAKGVAPDADVYVYRVLGPYGSGDTVGVIAGIDKSIADGMDVINLSLGIDYNNPLDPSAIAVNNAMLSGVVTAVASGNAGPLEKSLGTPGAAAEVITVGASTVASTFIKMTAAAGEKTFDKLNLFAKNYSDNVSDLVNKTYGLVNVGIGMKSDYTGKDVKGKVALIERGTLTFDEKIKNAKEAGAAAAIVYNNVAGDVSLYMTESTGYVPGFIISKEVGEQLVGQKEITFTSVVNEKLGGDVLGDFSSVGPVEGTDNIKPDVVGPGVSIYSTFPEYVSNPQDGIDYSQAYASISGTSMATPHVAGTAALILQAHPEYTSFDVKAILMNTADEMNGSYSVNQIGSGRIDAYEAVHSDMKLIVKAKTKTEQNGELVDIEDLTGSISFGSQIKKKGEAIQDTGKIEITNSSNQEKKFKVTSKFLSARGEVMDAAKNGVTFTHAKSIAIGAKQSEEIQATIELPADAEFGRYEGYLTFVNEQNNEETYQIPFAIRAIDKGIEKFKLNRPMISNDVSKNNPFLSPATSIAFKIFTQFKTFDFLVKDSKTGKAVGFIASINGENLLAGVEYTIQNGFDGLVYPFTNDPKNPIGNQLVELPEGDYKVEVIGVDIEGEHYSKSAVAIIDNTPPEVTVSKEPGVYEVSEDMYSTINGTGPAVWLKGTIYDSTVDLLKEKGINYDQSINGVLMWEANPYDYYFVGVDQEGNFNAPIFKDDIEYGLGGKGYETNFFMIDRASASERYPQGIKKYVWLKEGTEYATPSYNKSKVKLNEKVTMTLSLNNIKDFASGSFTIPYASEFFTFDSVKVNDKFKKYVEQKGANVTVKAPVFTTDRVKVEAEVNKAGFKLDEDLPFLDVTFTLKDDRYYNEDPKQFNVSSFVYKKTATSYAEAIRVHHIKYFEIQPSTSMISGALKLDAFLKADGSWNYDIDHTKLGVKIYAKTPNGKTYQALLDKYGLFTIDNVPISEKVADVYIQAPGHLHTKTHVKLSKNIDGEEVGTIVSASPYMEKNYAGDVNGDKVIDIQDVVQLVAFYGKSNKAADLNQDGIVNEKDARLLEKNFMRVGYDVQANKKPVEKLGNKGIAEFFKAIGLELKN